MSSEEWPWHGEEMKMGAAEETVFLSTHLASLLFVLGSKNQKAKQQLVSRTQNPR